MSDLDQLGKVIAEQTHKAYCEQATLWERTLRLHVKPKPAWMPDRLWAELVSLVLVQSIQDL